MMRAKKGWQQVKSTGARRLAWAGLHFRRMNFAARLVICGTVCWFPGGEFGAYAPFAAS